MTDRVDTMNVLEERLIHSHGHGAAVGGCTYMGSNLFEDIAEVLGGCVGRRDIGHSTERAAVGHCLEAVDCAAL